MGSTEPPTNPSAQGVPCDPAVAADFARVYLNEDERHGMIERNLGLVRVVVDRMKLFLPPTLDLDDLYSVGVQGLITATRKFDPAQGTVFAAFATLHIRGAVRDELRRMDWIPRSVRDKAKRLRDAIEGLEGRLGRPASEVEICAEMGLSLDQYGTLLDEIKPVSFIPLDAESDWEDSGEVRVADRIADESQRNAFEMLEQRELVQQVLDQMGRMPELQRKVLAMYYFENMRLAEIAAAFSLTEGRISQIHTQAVMSLRTFVKRITNSEICF
jgi:RNA polymerase sigma factor for flagellar operon FliA